MGSEAVHVVSLLPSTCGGVLSKHRQLPQGPHADKGLWGAGIKAEAGNGMNPQRWAHTMIFQSLLKTIHRLSTKTPRKLLLRIFCIVEHACCVACVVGLPRHVTAVLSQPFRKLLNPPAFFPFASLAASRCHVCQCRGGRQAQQGLGLNLEPPPDASVAPQRPQPALEDSDCWVIVGDQAASARKGLRAVNSNDNASWSGVGRDQLPR